MPGLLAPQIRAGIGSLLNYQPYPVQTPWGTQGLSLGDVTRTGLEVSPILGDLAAVNEGVNQWSTSPGLSLLNFASAIPGIGSVGDLAHMGLLGVTAFHGSPHVFDAFDLSKIGTGEGAQAYGHGIYLAENPGVASTYKHVLPGTSNRHGQELQKIDSMIQLNANQYTNGDVQAFGEMLRNYKGELSNKEKMLERIKDWKGNERPNFLYTVDLPDEHIAKMLDWDKPLSEQPKHIQEVAKELGVPLSKKGNELYWQAMRSKYGVAESIPFHPDYPLASKYASDLLNSKGIPGTKYLDQGSRGEGQGTRNFVIFDPSIAKITGRE